MFIEALILVFSRQRGLNFQIIQLYGSKSVRPCLKRRRYSKFHENVLKIATCWLNTNTHGQTSDRETCLGRLDIIKDESISTIYLGVITGRTNLMHPVPKVLYK